ncbi:MAG TPA: MBL fold metallo-hydrolase [Acholeplasmataceae bacterium]|nr:MBL fold metallo-hydrolase [Acholeplasmataceae bacterium]
MIIKCLTDNIAYKESFLSEHGLSIYFEVNNKKILFDTGATDVFIKNSKQLKVELKDVDFLIISHGHYDHGGGLEEFLNINSKAKIYIQKTAFNDFYSLQEDNTTRYIGLDKSFLNNERFILIDNEFEINNFLTIFSKVSEKVLFPSGNKHLLVYKNHQLEQDGFTHEQYLIVKEKDKVVLVTGCSHKGIINIINECKKTYKLEIDYVIGGFHLFSHSKSISEEESIIKEYSSILLENDIIYYTCHCTGEEAYKLLKKNMGKKINYLSSGMDIKL